MRKMLVSGVLWPTAVNPRSALAGVSSTAERAVIGLLTVATVAIIRAYWKAPKQSQHP